MHNNSPTHMPDLSTVMPQRRDKMEGGKRFILHTEFQATGGECCARGGDQVGVSQCVQAPRRAVAKFSP